MLASDYYLFIKYYSPLHVSSISAHLQEDIVLYKQHMIPSLSIRVLVACRYAARVRTDWRGKVVVRAS